MFGGVVGVKLLGPPFYIIVFPFMSDGVVSSDVNSRGGAAVGGGGDAQGCCQRVAAGVSAGSEVDDGAGDVGNRAWKTRQPGLGREGLGSGGEGGPGVSFFGQ